MRAVGYTRFWLIRHALVAAEARQFLYGRMDVALCADTLMRQLPAYAALAARLPRPARWVVSPLARARRTAEAIGEAGYPAAPLEVEPDLTEQDLGAWQGLLHEELPGRLAEPAHAFWPLGAAEVPPGGESMERVVRRVGAALERISAATPEGDVVCVSHGGAIRGAVAHALGVDARAALHLAVNNLSLTVLERHAAGWRVVTVNEGPHGA